jgi:putative nucleotidyltransferase with HDIG domain
MMYMKERLLKVVPEIDLIKDEALREKVSATFLHALDRGGYCPEDIGAMPFTLLIDPCPVTMREHIRGVTLASIGIADALKKVYAGNAKMRVEPDTLIAGALLHDVGKFLEIERVEDGKFVKSASGRMLRHPLSGAALAFSHGLPEEVLHIIACHAKEGDGVRSTVEAIIVHHADFANFEPLR